jgi:hypothetical protein
MIRSATARALFIAAALMAFCVLPAMATTVVIPNVNTNTPGPSNNAFPYNEGQMRVQQVFARDQFQGLIGPITQIAFRIDESAGSPFTSGPIDTEVRLSYTTVVPTAMNLNFAANITSPQTLVYDGLLNLSSAGAGFDIVIPVNPTFNYDGTQNLLVEYKVFGPAVTTQFDAAGTGIGEGGTPWVDRVWAVGDPNAVSGSSDGDDGYVTQFTIAAATAVEPTSWGAIKATFK